MSVESNSRLLWFCFTSLCDWLTKLGPVSQPMGIQIKTNRVLTARAWRQLHVFASNSDLLVVLFTSVVIGQSNYFGFGFTALNYMDRTQKLWQTFSTSFGWHSLAFCANVP